jgi:hypothetical protein
MAFFLVSCSTKVDIYADYKEIPVVYGLMEAEADTNFVKITKAFCGNNDNPINAFEVAQIYDSSEYPGKLDARIVEYKASTSGQYAPTGRVIVLDTMTIHNKQTGAFYAPDQKVYYTTERFNQNSGNYRYKYRIVVAKDNDTISAETGIVGGENFSIYTQAVTFNPEPGNKTGKVMFKPAENAAMYEVKMVFNFKEKRPGQDTVRRQVSWSLGQKSVSELTTENMVYVISYGQGLLFSMLRDAIGDDTHNVDRFIDNFVIQLAAGGEELFNYIQVNSPSEGISQTIPDYTNINGGYGVFSSRINLEKRVIMTSSTILSLYGMDWGFKQD